MIKSRIVTLEGKDKGRSLRMSELPALRADRAARAALRRLGEESTGGVVVLALRHMQALLALGQEGIELLRPFTEGTITDAKLDRMLQLENLRDWRNVGRLQQLAVLMHVEFLFDRQLLEVPVSLQAEQILQGVPNTRVTWCSAHIAAVLSSRLATYRELETVLSTEDVFNLVEIVNVDAIRDWHIHQKAKES